MKERYDDYWFPAKRFGWGWGLPKTWQGWIVFVGYIAAVLLVSNLVPRTQHPFAYYAALFVFTAVLITICWLKGEPPRWRWGTDDLK